MYMMRNRAVRLRASSAALLLLVSLILPVSAFAATITWTDQTAAGSREWFDITSSADGTKLAAVVYGGDIYTSTDSGATWTDRTAAGSRGWYDIVSSGDGTKLAAVDNGGYIYTSTDSGATWTEQTASGSGTWISIASSDDGTRLAAVIQGVGGIYTSTDSGATWTEQTTAGSRNWYAITSSSDGTKLAAVVYNGLIYTSTDSGATWTGQTNSGIKNWISITSSDDGTRLAAVATVDYNYASFDSGATWTAQTSAGPRGWYSITSSSDGAKVAGVVRSADIWTGVLSTPPAVTTDAASAIASTSATGNGTITDVGNAVVTVRGFAYGTTTSYTATTTESGSFSTGAFAASFTGLSCNTTYHYAAYAVNIAGTSTQPDASFTTSDCPVISDPMDSSSNSRSRSGSSIQSRVKNLMDMGNTAAANALKSQWPHLFGNLGTSASVITKSSDNIMIRDLMFGMTGDDVLALQKLLNAGGFVLAPSGAGAPGHETSFFGARTKAALAKYQAARGVAPSAGYFGPVTRAQMKAAGVPGVWW
jgi:photosystem II stability/assembly factor-like uncharacterized protein